MIATLPYKPILTEIHSQPTASSTRAAIAERLGQGPKAWQSLGKLVRAGLGKIESGSLILTTKDGNMKAWPENDLSESEIEDVVVLLLAAKHIQISIDNSQASLIIVDRAERVLRYRLIAESQQLVKE